ncbi:MAG: hypothetical protein RIS43_283, partial [Actinomycetota bacterium]
AVAGYAISIMVSYLTTGSHGASGSDVSPWFLVLVYLGFAALIGLNARGLWRGNGSARTPYLVTQAFAVVVAQTLLSGANNAEVIGGWALIVIAVTGAISILRPSASQGLNIHR